MCKYCKRLKELKDLDEKEYLKTIKAWKLRDAEARALVSFLYRILLSDGVDTLFFHERVVNFLSKTCVRR